MSRENVEIVRAAAAAYNRGDLETLMEAYDPAVELVTLLQGTRGDLIAFLFTIEGGLIVRQQTFRNKQEALEAAGRSE